MAANARNAPEVVLLRQGSIVKKSPCQFEQSHRVTPSPSLRSGLRLTRSRAGSEPMRFAQGKLREGSVTSGSEILRCAEA
jgi:hypothetical protein